MIARRIRKLKIKLNKFLVKENRHRVKDSVVKRRHKKSMEMCGSLKVDINPETVFFLLLWFSIFIQQ